MKVQSKGKNVLVFKPHHSNSSNSFSSKRLINAQSYKDVHSKYLYGINVQRGMDKIWNINAMEFCETIQRVKCW